MARRRMIDPNIWESEDYAKLSVLAKLLFVGMISNADDVGCGRASAVYLRSKVFPYDESISSSQVSDALDEISASLSVLFYRCGGNEYYAMRNWKKWQRVDKPQKSNIPAYHAEDCEKIRGSGAVEETEDGQEDVLCETDGMIPDFAQNDSGTVPAETMPKRKEEKEKRKEEEIRAVCAHVIHSLNDAAGTQFRTDGKVSLRLIGERLSEGYTQEEFLRVIGRKCAEWKDSPMQNFLRPETLFGEKFESYVNQKGGALSRGAPAAPKHGRMACEHDYDAALIEQALFGKRLGA